MILFDKQRHYYRCDVKRKLRPNIILKNDNKFAILALLIQTQIDISRAAYNVHVFLLITVYFSNPTKYMCLQLLYL